MTRKDTQNELRQRAEEYAIRHALTLERSLGFGNDGAVWETSVGTALKIEERQSGFDRELGCYLRLQRNDVAEIHGFAVPQLVNYDTALWAVEMTFVFPPCILDFAKSYLDRPPDYGSEVLAEWEEQTQELFGEQWLLVRRLLNSLRAHGIYYFDAKLSNIRFEN